MHLGKQLFPILIVMECAYCRNDKQKVGSDTSGEFTGKHFTIVKLQTSHFKDSNTRPGFGAACSPPTWKYPYLEQKLGVCCNILHGEC